MLSQESVSRIAKPLLATGLVVDAVHKFSDFYHILPVSILGKGTLIEKHIGNFGTATILTSVVRNKILDNIPYFDRLEKKKGEEYVEKLKNCLAFISVAALYIAWESFIFPLAKGSNPEMVGDIAVALAAPLLYLASYPKHRDSILF